MAKVMISIPDELLERVDARVSRDGTTRSAWLRSQAERALNQDPEDRAARIRAYLDRAKDHGGNSAEAIRADRDRGMR
jgi:metal-responsive CopG/Arc/MetJ family transcriptional regulator